MKVSPYIYYFLIFPSTGLETSHPTYLIIHHLIPQEIADIFKAHLTKFTDIISTMYQWLSQMTPDIYNIIWKSRCIAAKQREKQFNLTTKHKIHYHKYKQKYRAKHTVDYVRPTTSRLTESGLGQHILNNYYVSNSYIPEWIYITTANYCFGGNLTFYRDSLSDIFDSLYYNNFFLLFSDIEQNYSFFLLPFDSSRFSLPSSGSFSYS